MGTPLNSNHDANFVALVLKYQIVLIYYIPIIIDCYWYFSINFSTIHMFDDKML